MIGLLVLYFTGLSQSSRKNAIMAVAKSANATFHEPP